MSKWGKEENETIEAINILSGDILNVAAGDGRFNDILLEISNSVMAIDINKEELDELYSTCNQKYKEKLQTKIVDITKNFPFDDNSFDSIFCTGTLHLFNSETIKSILNEFNRVLKTNGKIVLDFATDIVRYDNNNNLIKFDNEGNYTIDDAITIFNQNLDNYDIKFIKSEFKEENLDLKAGYSFIQGNFLVIIGTKK